MRVSAVLVLLAGLACAADANGAEGPLSRSHAESGLHSFNAQSDAKSGVHALNADFGSSGVYGLNTAGSQTGLFGFNARHPVGSSAYALKTGLGTSGVYGLNGAGSNTGLFGLSAGNPVGSSAYALKTGLGTSGVYGLNAAGSKTGLFGFKARHPVGSGAYALNAGAAGGAVFSAPQFSGDGRHLDYTYGSSTVQPSNPTQLSMLCGTPRSYTRHVLMSAAKLVNVQNEARGSGIAKPKILSEPEFLLAVSTSLACFQNLYLPGKVDGPVVLGSIAMFNDPAIPTGRRFAIAVNKQRCGSLGNPNEYMWVYLDDGFPAVSSCSTVQGLVGTIGPSTAAPLTVFNPRS